MSEWQPIETAPKDGTSILVCGTDGGDRIKMAVVWWLSDGSESAWLVDDDSQFIDPTHWMPLPDPPIGRGWRKEGAGDE